MSESAAGSQVGPHVLKFKGILDHLARLGVEFQKEVAVDYVACLLDSRCLISL